MDFCFVDFINVTYEGVLSGIIIINFKKKKISSGPEYGSFQSAVKKEPKISMVVALRFNL